MAQVNTAAPVRPLETIQGVFIAEIRVFEDERGRFMETFRREWFPEVDWTKIQTNRSDSRAGVVRGLHYHHHQVDYWYVTQGRVRAGLVDLRPNSPTYLAASTLEIGEGNNVGLFIPVGVAHGFAALTDCTLMYLVNNYYDGGKDEFGIAWNDPQIGLDWGIHEAEAKLSPRDLANPPLSAIAPNHLPR
ncbi:MAG: dTDP-4-dehydrorhamnose 3,5-epimerase [bacterium]|nr:dTDP-4-dehydrorhamnose 3,5-epimerase [bacterium]